MNTPKLNEILFVVSSSGEKHIGIVDSVNNKNNYFTICKLDTNGKVYASYINDKWFRLNVTKIDDLRQYYKKLIGVDEKHILNQVYELIK